MLVTAKGIKSTNAQLGTVDAAARKAGGGATAMGSRFAKAAKLAAAALAVTLVMGLKGAVTAGASFERQMSSLAAVTEATAAQQGKLEKQALKLGEATQYNARQTAEAQIELAKGGLGTSEIIGGALPAALSLAAAGQLELADAATATVNAMKLFGLEGKEATMIADLYATAANTTTADVGDFAMAMTAGGSAAKQAGLDINETVVILESLAEAGIKNSDAGTSLKTSFIQLLAPSTKQKKLAEELGIVWTKRNGTLKSGIGISRELHRVTDDMTKAERLKVEATLAGTDGFRTLAALYDAGPAKLERMTRANQKQGTAQEVASKKMDNLQGDWEQFTGAIETAEIKLYGLLKGPLREATQVGTEIVQSLSNANYGEILGEVEQFYEGLHDATKVHVAGSNFSLFPEADELKESSQWIVNASKNTSTALVKGYQWTENASRNSYNAIIVGSKGAVTGWNAFTGAIKDGAAWIGRASSNVGGFVSSLIPVKVVALLAYLSISKLVDAVDFAVGAVMVFMPAYQAAARIIGTVVAAAVDVASASIQVFLKYVGNMGAVFGDVVGLVSNLLRGKWGAAWNSAKDLVVDVLHTIEDLYKGAWTVMKTATSAGVSVVKSVLKNGFSGVRDTFESAADFMGGAFSGAWGKIESTFVTGANGVIDVINAVIGAINLIPGIPDIGKIGHVGSHGVSNAKVGKDVNGRSLGRQTGGAIPGTFTVPGSGSGDTVPMLLPPGSFVENREAAKMPFQSGGLTPVMLEPKERVWLPPAVGRAGLGNLKARNSQFSRFQKGGPVGLISGGDVLGGIAKVVEVAGSIATNPGRLIGESAASAKDVLGKLPSGGGIPEPFSGVGPWVVDEVKDWIGSLPGSVFGGGGGGSTSGYTGPPANMQQLGDNSYVDSHTLAVTALLDRKFGLTMSSGYRSPQHNAEIGGAPGSLHTHGSPANPGATDSVGSIGAMNSYIAFAKKHVAGLQEAMVDNYAGLGSNAHIGFFRLGGLIQALTSGGSVLGIAGPILARNGLDLVAGAGVMGNSYGESEWNTDAMEPGTHNGGLFGFTAGEKSLSSLESYASSHGHTWKDTATQIKFMLSTLPTGMREAMNKMSKVDETTSYFMHEWERPENYSSLGKRVSAAHRAVEYFKNHGYKNAAEADEHSFKEDVPKTFHGLLTDVHLPSSTPKTVERFDREIGQMKEELAKYHRVTAVARKAHKPKVEQALVHSATDIAQRLRELRHDKTKLKRKVARDRFTRKTQRRLATLTGFEPAIEEAQRRYEELGQTAGQAVDLEPLQPQLPREPQLPDTATDKQRVDAHNTYERARQASEEGYVSQLTAYVEGIERPAYGKTLDSAAIWRNTILDAQAAAVGPWQKQNVLDGVEGGWEDRIITLVQNEESIEEFIERVNDRVSDWRSSKQEDEGKKRGKGKKKGKHQKKAGGGSIGGAVALGMPEDLQHQVDTRDRLLEKLPELKFREKQLRESLGEGRGYFYPGKAGRGVQGVEKIYHLLTDPLAPAVGSGTFEEDLRDVQGIHWPGQHDKIDKLPASPSLGQFGGAIWETQTAIKELGLRIGEAGAGIQPANIETPGSGMDDKTSELLAVTQQLLREANTRNAVAEAQGAAIEGWRTERTNLNSGSSAFAGFFATGGTIPAGKWGISGENGPEPVFAGARPATVFSNGEAQEMFGGGSTSIQVVIKGDIAPAPGVSADEVIEVLERDPRSKQVIRRTALGGRGVGRSTPGDGIV